MPNNVSIDINITVSDCNRTLQLKESFVLNVYSQGLYNLSSWNLSDSIHLVISDIFVDENTKTRIQFIGAIHDNPKTYDFNYRINLTMSNPLLSDCSLTSTIWPEITSFITTTAMSTTTPNINFTNFAANPTPKNAENVKSRIARNAVFCKENISVVNEELYYAFQHKTNLENQLLRFQKEISKLYQRMTEIEKHLTINNSMQTEDKALVSLDEESKETDSLINYFKMHIKENEKTLVLTNERIKHFQDQYDYLTNYCNNNNE